jgi:hypothetical protein
MFVLRNKKSAVNTTTNVLPSVHFTFLPPCTRGKGNKVGPCRFEKSRERATIERDFEGKVVQTWTLERRRTGERARGPAKQGERKEGRKRERE